MIGVGGYLMDLPWSNFAVEYADRRVEAGYHKPRRDR